MYFNIISSTRTSYWYTLAIDLPGQVGAVEVPERGGFVNGEGLRDLDDTSASGIGGEVGNLRSVLAHPLLEGRTEISLGPAYDHRGQKPEGKDHSDKLHTRVDGSGGDTLVFERSTPLAGEPGYIAKIIRLENSSRYK